MQPANSDHSIPSILRSLAASDAMELGFPSSACPELSIIAADHQVSALRHNGSQGQSKPINIAVAKREYACSPLSARGDTPRGHFPNHENSLSEYKADPFSTKPVSDYPEPLLASSISSSTSGPVLSLPGSNSDVPTLHLGKYHPSKCPFPSAATPPTTDQSSTSLLHLEISSEGKNATYERGASDLKGGLQQYGQDRTAQTRRAKPLGPPTHDEPARIFKFSSPRLQPLDSPGWITPFEMD